MSDPTSTKRPHRRDLSLTMPENHLDTVVTTNSIDTNPARQASAMTKIIGVVIMPLFFLVVFSLCYTSALHAPVPNSMPLTIAGPAATTQRIVNGIDKQADGAFDTAQTTNAAEARRSVAERDSAGALVIDGTKVTTIIGSGGGVIASTAVKSVGAQVAAELGGTTKVVDVAPTTTEDRSGTSLFYLLIICTIGGYLSITVLTQALPRARTRTMVITAAGAALLTPIIGWSMISIFVGDYGSTFGTISAVIGIGMIYTLTIGLLATLFTKALGQGAIFAVILFLIGLNFPSSGGAAPASMLPGFWQFIHSGWVGSGGLEAMRSVVFFDGHQVGRWLLQLGAWTVGSAVLVTVVGMLRKRQQAQTGDSEQAAAASAAVSVG